MELIVEDSLVTESAYQLTHWYASIATSFYWQPMVTSTKFAKNNVSNFGQSDLLCFVLQQILIIYQQKCSALVMHIKVDSYS